MLLKEILDKSLQFNKNSIEFDDLKINEISRDSTVDNTGKAYFCLTHDLEKAKLRCEQALKNGALVVFSDFNLPFEKCVKVEDCRDLFANSCANFYHRACDKLKIVGITGTNGKTTTSHVVAEILKRNGKKVGVIGTSGVFYNGKVQECPLTTPDADFLHKTFSEMLDDGVEYVIMEVSAHAIDQKRINGIKFELGVLTNVTQDHLDYFKTFEAYEKTKLSFLTSEHIKKGIVCADDKCARKLIGNTDVPILTYGLFSPSDVFAIDICCSMNGTHFVGNVCDCVVDIKTNLVGQYNVYNSLASLAVCQCLGLNEEQLVRGINFINPVEGRFNVININGRYAVIDFAHSPDSMMNVLKAARELTDKKVYVVFGCGGNRDKGKRPQMGKIAEKYADYVCLTDDNPRLEKSLDIIADIEKGMKKPHFVETDRYKAIKKMIEFAKPGDIVIIAGKGAEKYQEIGTEKRPYNDFESVYNYFEESNPIKNRNNKEYYGC